METEKKNTAVTRQEQCSGRMFEAENWNNLKSRTVRTGRRSMIMEVTKQEKKFIFNPLNAELNPIRHLLALVGARHIVHVSSIRVNLFPRK